LVFLLGFALAYALILTALSASLATAEHRAKGKIDIYFASEAERYPLQGHVFAFETDSRGSCEIHGLPLFPADIPVTFGAIQSSYSLVLKQAPHGRLAVHPGCSPRSTRGFGDEMTLIRSYRINHCEACVQISEATWDTTRAEVAERSARCFNIHAPTPLLDQRLREERKNQLRAELRSRTE